MEHVSLGTLGRYLAMISAVSVARIKVEQTSFVYLKFRSLSLWPVSSACSLNKGKFSLELCITEVRALRNIGCEGVLNKDNKNQPILS